MQTQCWICPHCYDDAYHKSNADGCEWRQCPTEIDKDKTMICSECNGSGEGMHDGTVCPVCLGTGEVADDSGHGDNGGIEMGDIKSLSISTKKITIKVVQVAGSKMTKATFNQIQWHSLSDVDYIDNAIGWVYSGRTRILLWVKNGKLGKTYVDIIEQARTDRDSDGYIPIDERYDQLFIAT